MEIDHSMINIYEQEMDNISNQNNPGTSTSLSIEEILNDHSQHDQHTEEEEDRQQHNNENNDHDQDIQTNNENNQEDEPSQNMDPVNNTQINNGIILLKINEINTDIDFPWKIQGIISCKHQKRMYNNANGSGEISTWDLVDDTASINLVAFNLNSNMMSHILVQGNAYEFNSLSIRTVDDNYKTLSHGYQLIVTNKTYVQEITKPFNYEIGYNFINLSNIETLPLNSIIDVQVRVIRDYGTTSGNTNDNPWRRRELHVGQDGLHTRLVLWNQQANQIQTTMINMNIKLKNVKISWYNGSRNLVSLGNTHLSIV